MLTPEQRVVIAEAYADGVSAAEIACELGVSRQWVWKLARGAGVAARRRDRIKRICPTCFRWFSVQRWRAKRNRRVFCCPECYYQAIRRPEYVANRQAQVRARRLVKEFYQLLDGEVVHHIDGDSSNNDLGNLMVFASHSDHMRWHRAGGPESGVVPKWRWGPAGDPS